MGIIVGHSALLQPKAMARLGRLLKFSGASSRNYYASSLEHAPSKNIAPLNYSKDSPQYRVLSHALEAHVPELGFREEAVLRSLNDLKMPSSMINIIGAAHGPSPLRATPPAVLELLQFNLVDKRLRATENVRSRFGDDERVLDHKMELPSLEEMLLQRLQMDIPLRAHLSDLMSELSFPGEYLINTSLPELHRLADDLIFYSNERDHHDFAWYSKRLGVSMAYVTSKLYMAADKSADCAQTMQFARDKLHKVMKLGDYYNNTEEFAWYTLMSCINLARSQLARG